MLKVSIKGLKDGLHEFEARADSASIEGMFPEFIGEIVVRGSIRKVGMRFIVEGLAQCEAQLECDVSGETFQQMIETDINVPYVADTNMFHLHRDDVDPEPPYYLHEDASDIDLTNEVREELAVHLPMKRVAPQYRDQDITTLYPGVAGENEGGDDDEEPIDKRWEALKNVKFSDN